MEIASEHNIVRFIVQITQHHVFLQPHEVYVVGNIDKLGNWEPRNGLKMKLFSHERLEAEIKIPKNLHNIIEYKYVNITSNDGQINWEHGENRVIQQLDSEFVQIQDQYRDNLPRHAQLPAGIFTLDRMFGRVPETKTSLQVPPNDTVLLRFNVSAGTTHPSYRIAVSGSCPQLGDWDMQRAVTMKYTYPSWEIDVYVPRKLFPIEYKYVTCYAENPYTGDFEVGQNRRVDLPAIFEEKNSCVVELHDNYLSRYFSYNCMTTFADYSIMQEILNQAKHKALSEIVSVDDGKLIVGCCHAIAAGRTYRKPFKKIINVEEYFIENSFNLALEREALVNPESSVKKLWIEPSAEFLTDELGKEISIIIKENRTISKIEIFHEETEMGDVDWNIDWLFNGLAHNKFPNIASLGFANYNDDHDRFFNAMLEAIKTNKSLTKLNFYLPEIDTAKLCRALEVNTSLTDLSISVARTIDENLLISTISSLKRIKCLSLTATFQLAKFAPLTKTLRKLQLFIDYMAPLNQMREFFAAVKDSTTLTSLSLRGGVFNDSAEDFQTLWQSLYDENWTLTSIDNVWKDLSPKSTALFVRLQEKNRKYHRQLHEDLILIIYNIARSKEALDLFPKEVWCLILSFVQTPFSYDYRSIMSELFKDNAIRKL